MRRYLDQRLKLRQLRIVAAVARQGSLLKASQTLGLTQPAVTKALREVEELLELRLFDRHARGVTANAYGQVLAEAGQRVLDMLRDAETAFDQIEGRAGGSVAIGALPTAAAGIMPQVVHRLRVEAPDIAINVIEGRTDELMSALALGDIDLVVGRLYPPRRDDTQFVRLALYEEPMALIVGAQHPLATASLVDAASLAPFDLSLPAASFRIREETEAFLVTYGLTLKLGATTTSLMLLRELLLSTTLVTAMPALMLGGDLARGTLVALALDPACVPPARPAGLIHRADRPLHTAATRVADTIRETASSVSRRAGNT